MRIGLEKFVATFAGPHPITLMTVADRPTIRVNSTTSKAQLLSGVKRLFIQPDAGATMIEGIVEASKAIVKRKPARAAIVVLTSFGAGVQRSWASSSRSTRWPTQAPRFTYSSCRTRCRRRRSTRMCAIGTS